MNLIINERLNLVALLPGSARDQLEVDFVDIHLGFNLPDVHLDLAHLLGNASLQILNLPSNGIDDLLVLVDRLVDGQRIFQLLIKVRLFNGMHFR